MKLSIIIPVYNVAPFISRCLDSCIAQDLPKDDYEIICVDDGCTDDSVLVINRYATNHNNILLLHQQNAGQSAARNYGVTVAKGDYIWFVDGDDWIEPNVLKIITEQAYREELDSLCFTFQFAYENGAKSDGGLGMLSFSEAINGRDFISKYTMPAGPWCAIHRRDFLVGNNIHFIEGIRREDEDYTTRAYCSAERISYVNIVAYNYYQRAGSTMKSQQSVKTAADLLKVADSLYDFAQHLKNTHQKAYWAVLNRVSFAVSQSLAYCEGGVINLDQYRTKPFYPLSINPLLSFKNKWKYRLINLSLGLYLKVYHMI